MINNEEDKECYISPSNIFADDGRPDPEGRMMRVRLMKFLVKEIKERGLSQRQAASLLGVRSSRVRHLLEARMSKFPLESLLAMMVRLGVRVGISDQPEMIPSGQITICLPQFA